MSKKRTPKTETKLPNPDADATAEQTAGVHATEAAGDAAATALSEGTNSVEDASNSLQSERRPKGKKSKRDKKEKAAKAAKAAEGDNHEKPEKKAKRGKKNKKEKAAKAVKPSKREQDIEQAKKAKRDKPKGKKDKSTIAPKLRPLRKVNVLLIEPDGQPRAHFDGEIGVLDLMLPKKAEGDDSGA